MEAKKQAEEAAQKALEHQTQVSLSASNATQGNQRGLPFDATASTVFQPIAQSRARSLDVAATPSVTLTNPVAETQAHSFTVMNVTDVPQPHQLDLGAMARHVPQGDFGTRGSQSNRSTGAGTRSMKDTGDIQQVGRSDSEDELLQHLEKCADAVAELSAMIEQATQRWQVLNRYERHGLTPAFQATHKAMKKLWAFEVDFEPLDDDADSDAALNEPGTYTQAMHHQRRPLEGLTKWHNTEFVQVRHHHPTRLSDVSSENVTSQHPEERSEARSTSESAHGSNRRLACAGLASAAAAGMWERHRSKSRSGRSSIERSRSRERIRGPISSAGLGDLALAALYEKRKARDEYTREDSASDQPAELSGYWPESAEDLTKSPRLVVNSELRGREYDAGSEDWPDVDRESLHARRLHGRASTPAVSQTDSNESQAEPEELDFTRGTLHGAASRDRVLSAEPPLEPDSGIGRILQDPANEVDQKSTSEDLLRASDKEVASTKYARRRMGSTPSSSAGQARRSLRSAVRRVLRMKPKQSTLRPNSEILGGEDALSVPKMRHFRRTARSYDVSHADVPLYRPANILPELSADVQSTEHSSELYPEQESWKLNETGEFTGHADPTEASASLQATPLTSRPASMGSGIAKDEGYASRMERPFLDENRGRFWAKTRGDRMDMLPIQAFVGVSPSLEADEREEKDSLHDFSAVDGLLREWTVLSIPEG